MWESRRNYSGGKGESSLFRSVEIKAQLMMAADGRKGPEWVGEAEGRLRARQ